jgi:hypothetical protein
MGRGVALSRYDTRQTTLSLQRLPENDLAFPTSRRRLSLKSTVLPFRFTPRYQAYINSKMNFLFLDVTAQMIYKAKMMDVSAEQAIEDTEDTLPEGCSRPLGGFRLVHPYIVRY